MRLRASLDCWTITASSALLDRAFMAEKPSRGLESISRNL